MESHLVQNLLADHLFIVSAENFRSKNAKPTKKIMKYFSCRISSTADSNSLKNA
uniref:Uncharacterized protein n=1 Tax=Arundo donax TaxID=35708 RepID=A0A0A9CCQ6_ARUDO